MNYAIPVYNPHARDQQGELMQVGVPFATGALSDVQQLALQDESGADIASQSRVLSRWPDGSIRWAITRWNGALAAGAESKHKIHITDAAQADDKNIANISDDAAVAIDTGCLRLQLAHDPAQLIQKVSLQRTLDGEWISWDPSVEGGQLFAELEDATLTAKFTAPVEVLDNGPLLAEIYYRGVFEDDAGVDRLRFRLRIIAHKDSQQLRVSMTYHNPRHQPREEVGNFRLGLPNAAMIKDAGLRFALRDPEGAGGAEGAENVESKGIPFAMIGGEEADFQGPLTGVAKIHQDSSGNANWFHRSNLTRDYEFPQQFRGFKMTVNDTEAYTGDHAPGWAAVADQRNSIAIGVEKFWQSFPQVLRCEKKDNGSVITAALFPAEAKCAQELVGGEQKTHHLVLSFHRIDKKIDDVYTVNMPSPQGGYVSMKAKMEALLARPIYLPSAQQCIDAQVFQETRPYDAERFAEYELAVDCIFEDPAFTLWDLRDKWDHYGWRNFGDFNADYEGGGDILSHHNNEYDYSRGLMMQAIRRNGLNDASARQFIEAGLYAAIHQADIDTYHTSEDPHGGYAYNGGKFTHTEHLLEPGRAGHRQSDCHAMYGDLDWPWGKGGGPESGHYDNEGMMLAHYLTGDPVLAEAAMEVADNVAHKVTTDNFAQHDYYRTSGHNFSCLLIGYFHTCDQKYIDVIETIVALTTPDAVQTDRQRDADGLFPAGSYFNGNYLRPLIFYIENWRRLFGTTPELALQSVQTYADCMHRYCYDEDLGRFACVPQKDTSTQNYGLAQDGGESSWFHIDAFCWAAQLREDPAQRDREIVRAMRHYLQLAQSLCPDGRAVYHNNKTFTYTVSGGHAIMCAIDTYPHLFEQAQ
ncbi:MAG: hypothetical protein HRU15_12790 [Planctomycetes bacterium]|nr:hypothetical protein [Planctomycetota bacterium]